LLSALVKRRSGIHPKSRHDVISVALCIVVSGLLYPPPAAGQSPPGGALAPPRVWPVCHAEGVLASRERIRLLARLMTVGGEQILHQRPLALVRDGRVLPCRPPGCRAERKRFSESGQPLSVAVLWETSLAMQGVYAELQAAVASFVGRLPETSRVWLMPLRSREPGGAEPQSPSAAGPAVLALSSTEDTEVALVDGVAAAARVLAADSAGHARRPPPRLALLVVGSGLDVLMLPARFAQLGDRLSSLEVPLYAVALSPRNYQLPMLNLAELAWRSHGTFRWVKLQPETSVRALLDEQLDALLNELQSSEQVTFSGEAIRSLLSQEPPPTQLALDCGAELSRPRPVHSLVARRSGRGIRPWLGAVLCMLLAGLWLVLGRRVARRRRRIGV